VVPGEVTWPLPLYELALMTAGQVFGMGGRAAITFLTPEAAPLGVFGPQGSAAVEQLLAQAGIELHAGRPVAVGRGRVSVVGGPDVDVQRVVTLPLLAGPDLLGVPADDDGFVPVDAHGRVAGMPGVYAMGDATTNPIKQGGLACQQADAVVAHVAALVAGRPEPEPVEPVLRGRLLTGGGDRFLERSFDQVHGSAAQDPLWWPPTKVSGRYLGPWLADQPGGGWDGRAQERPAGVDVAVGYDPLWRQADDVLGLEPLGRT
jgi:sulfide:quinone oxidoreductase